MDSGTLNFIIGFIIGIIFGIIIFKFRKPKNDNTTIIPIDENYLNNNEKLVNSYIDKYFYESLFYFLNKEITFDDNSVIKIQAKFKYRECIRNLMRPNVYYSNMTFKNVLIQRVSLYFMANTPKNIKNLIFSFNSGYTIDNYWDKKKDKPSIQPYIYDYIDKKINKCFLEVTKEEETMFKSTNVDSIKIDEMANQIDSKEYAKLCSFIYDINDDLEEVKPFSEENKTNKEIDK